MVELIKTCLASEAVIATCGNLPPPHEDNGYYQLLGQCAGKTILHVLVAPDNAVHVKKIRSKGQTTLTKKHTASNDRWQQHKTLYDLVLTGSESAAQILELIHTTIRRTRSDLV